MAELKKYDVEINGYETTLLLTAEDAEKRGLKEAKRPANKAAAKPANKSAS